jgi:hypothetical protein
LCVRDIVLEEFSAWIINMRCMTFRMAPGLADRNNPDMVSFRAWKEVSNVIQHQGTEVFIVPSETDEEFQRTATFIISPPNWDGKNRLSEKRRGENSLSRSRVASLGRFFFFLALVIWALYFVLENREKTEKSRSLFHKLFKVPTHFKAEKINSH